MKFGQKDKRANNQSLRSDQAVDPDSTVIKNAELRAMKDEIERLKDELYQVNVKVKRAESQQDILKRDH